MANFSRAPKSAAIAAIFMLAVMGLPLTLTCLSHFASPVARALRSEPLHEMTPPPERPKLTARSFLSRDYQRVFDDWFSAQLAPRSLVVRLTNQLFYSAFAKSHMYLRRPVIGRDQWLYETPYLTHYCEQRRPDLVQHLIPLVAKAGALRVALERRHRPLVFVVSASKAVAVPKFLPKNVCRPSRDPGDGARLLVAMLRNADVRVVDGPALVRRMKQLDLLPPFPRGGVHWTSLAAKRIASVTLAELNLASWQDLGSLAVGEPRWNAAPTAKDADMALLLNLFRPPLDYPAPTAPVECRATPSGRDATLISVGGSFAVTLLDPLFDCGLFREVVLYGYYTAYRQTWPLSPTPVVRKEVPWRAILEAPSAVLVELNETLIDTDMRHLHSFFEDATEALD